MPVLSVLARLYAYRSIVLLLLLAIAAGLIYYLYGENVQKEEEKQSIINLYSQQPETRAVDTQGRETVRVVTPIISAAVLKQVKSGLAAEIRDQLQKEFKGLGVQLISAQRVQTSTAQRVPTVALKDTTIREVTPAGIQTKVAKAGTYKDPWLTLTGVVTDDSLAVKYTIRNEFDVRAYSKRDAKHWWQFWKGRKVYVDLKNQNPNTRTENLEAVAVEKK
ncbi:hypothetical protein SAMN06265337_0619 [Hymenobacter gelipurpurascens]|uniref:Uncharacterized protein n=1 Tax=Hymenobacter gelipurpurascens TaxID=89968 RepID=A0A212T800_9BACT|nr:DUF6549 family protein [Hymenobacter gelipurpurascens]SNC62183.1 hypothetical protein SAMN06265337_0619 [Hymenobacter gelipurpurascens]